jgi:hypothetical protein
MTEDGYPQVAAIAAATQQPNAEDAKDTQRPQKKTKDNFFGYSFASLAYFCVLCVRLLG